jgi:uncharacterized DUF497 family protein
MSNSGFDQTQQLWLDVDAVEIPARSEIEERKMLIAKTGGKIWAAVFTEQQGRIRIISARPARTNEQAIYEQTEDDNAES